MFYSLTNNAFITKMDLTTYWVDLILFSLFDLVIFSSVLLIMIGFNDLCGGKSLSCIRYICKDGINHVKQYFSHSMTISIFHLFMKVCFYIVFIIFSIYFLNHHNDLFQWFLANRFHRYSSFEGSGCLLLNYIGSWFGFLIE